MLQAPIRDRKTKAEASSKTAEYLPEYEQSSQLIGGMGRFSKREASPTRQSQPLQQRENLANLQKVYGNQAVLRMIGRSPTTNPAQGRVLQRKCACGNSAGSSGSCAECQSKQEGILQTKLQIGEAGDRYEQEADLVADQVLRSPAPTAVSRSLPQIQRFTGQSTRKTDTVPASVNQALSSTGSPLEPFLQQDMERRFGQDFSQVRVHTGATAEQSAREVNANAYTVEHSIVFGAGQYAPTTNEGRRLIAHELTHVIQQHAGQPVLRRQVLVEVEDGSASGKASSQSEEMIQESFPHQGDTSSTTPAPAPPVSPPSPLPPGYKPEAWICGRPLRYPGLSEFFGHAFVAAPPDNYAIIAPLCEPTDGGSNGFISGTAARKWDNSPDPCDDKAECVVCQPKSGVKDVKKCLRDAFNTYNMPTLHKALGPNSNTLAGTLARTCCDGMSNATPFYSTFIYPGWGDSPAPSRPAKCSSGPPKCS